MQELGSKRELYCSGAFEGSKGIFEGSSVKSLSERFLSNSVSIAFQFGTAPKTLVSRSSNFKLDKEKLSKVYFLLNAQVL